jgi:hypothetical protein
MAGALLVHPVGQLTHKLPAILASSMNERAVQLRISPSALVI